MGYNGLPHHFSDLDGARLERPEKYNWMAHSEVNAVSNCLVRPCGASAIVTGICCNLCLIHLHQNDIHNVYMYDRDSSMLQNDEAVRLRTEVIRESSMNVHLISRDEQLEKMLENLNFSDKVMSFAKL